MIAGLIIGAVILLVMIGASWYGWLTLPASARVPVHWAGGYNNFISKRAGLLAHPAIGALVYVIIVVANTAQTAHGASLPLEVILPLVMCLLLVVQTGAIRVARRRSGPDLYS